MSIRHGLLALLSSGDAYGYQLRARFEALTSSVWPLNIGQVYTTLGRLERDGLVQGIGADHEGRVTYRLTDAGRDDLRVWWSSPVAHADRPRDELAIKIALAVTTPGRGHRCGAADPADGHHALAAGPDQAQATDRRGRSVLAAGAGVHGLCR